MKKLIATVLFVLIAFAAFAGINVTIDTIVQYGGKIDPTYEIPVGFSIGGADETVFADMNATLSGARGSALLNIRFRMPDEKYLGAAVEVHGWEITTKLADWLKMSIGNTAYELYAETISWEPIFGAGLFEQGKNRIYFDMQFDDLQIIAGMSMGTSDPKKPWNTAVLAAVYEIPMEFKLSAEIALVPTELCLTMYPDGKVKTFSFQANYIGTENLEALAGYTLILAESSIVQHRLDLYGSYLMDNFQFELYEALLLRLYSGETMGNRLGFRVSYFATDTLTPFVKFNWFSNYGYAATVGGFAWGDCQLVGPGTGTGLIVADAGLGFVVNDNISGSIGATFKFNLEKDANIKSSWAIPLCLTAMF